MEPDDRMDKCDQSEDDYEPRASIGYQRRHAKKARPIPHKRRVDLMLLASETADKSSPRRKNMNCISSLPNWTL